jgi:formylglycine-generating enzyme
MMPRRAQARTPGLPDGLVPGKRPGEFVNTVDGSVLLWVPAGAFRMGTSRSRPQEGPAHQVTLTRGYYIGKVPITWKRWRRFCRKTGRAMPTTVDFKSVTEITDKHPAVNVSWDDALDYCRWAKLRLPTEAEWELAARGQDGRAYPWGNEVPNDERANWEGNRAFGGTSTSPTGAFPRGASPCGALDMAGNVWEWTQDWFGAYRADPQTDPAGPKGGDARVLRGGCWQSDPTFLLTTARLALGPHERRNWVGFRVCRSG